MGGQKLRGPQLREVNYEALPDLKASPRGLSLPQARWQSLLVHSMVPVGLCSEPAAPM